jgi:hypothetical protein
MELGPDGALYVVDMYRAVIEHPDWVPDELKRAAPTSASATTAAGFGASFPQTPTPDRASEGLPLTSPKPPATTSSATPNAWHRETAHRLLLERQRQALIPKLREIATLGSNPHARASAIWIMASQSLLEESDVFAAIKDSDPPRSPAGNQISRTVPRS